MTASEQGEKQPPCQIPAEDFLGLQIVRFDCIFAENWRFADFRRSRKRSSHLPVFGAALHAALPDEYAVTVVLTHGDSVGVE